MILAVALPVLSLSFSMAEKNSLVRATQHQYGLLPVSHFHLSFEPTFPPAQLLSLCWASCYHEGQGRWINPKSLGFLFPIQKFSKDFCGAFQRIQIAKQNTASPFEHQRLRVWAHKHMLLHISNFTAAADTYPLFPLCVQKSVPLLPQGINCLSFTTG